MRTVLIWIVLVTFWGINGFAADKNTENNASKNETRVTATQVSSCTVSGNVYDMVAGESLTGVTVSVNGKKVFTDMDGNFSIPEVTGTECEIKVSMISYKPLVLKVPVRDASGLKINLQQ
ncbi:carboxypeptidase-like regulatory domain-containing protein [Coprobacter tertius]|uniref:Carboxypeptidase-like regulatory domain-containing protein n=1 Tax=Coprobacter tertius TaxID=2944915 RepID=A0ABT1MHG2_9BACT|nr:carboxypeptidase-like regulatory domain-containing protein [Coprobacter tertius]MCP9611821.1 carboxypeptidase-like regulatory domain-containing protein [Coprobacter tertius]